MTTMKLSEAIRLGAMLKPQVRGQYWKDGGSCALGAAADAIGLAADDVDPMCPSTIDDSSWPEPWQRLLFGGPVTCPACGDSMLDGRLLVIHLNDWEHNWTREQIADHLESIEQPQASPTAPPIPVPMQKEQSK